MDGTLLNGERRLSQTNIEAVKRATSAGIHVALASGRTLPSMRPFANQLGLEGPFVCANGAHVVGHHGEELAFHELARAPKQTVLEFAARNGNHVNAYTRDELLFNHASPWGEMYRSRLRSMVPKIATTEQILEAHVSKVMFVADPDEIPAMRASLLGLIAESEARAIESEPEYLEFLSPDADKCAGLVLLCSRLGIDRTEVAAIGDYLNDLEMLRWAGVSAGVANAHPDVLSSVDCQVPSNEDNGVAEFIDSILKSKRE